MASNAAAATLNRLLEALGPLGHPLAVMGGLALAAWNHIRATRDVDLLIAVDQGAIASVILALESTGFRAKRCPPLISVGEHHFVQLLYTPHDEFYDVQIDILLAESELQKSAIARRVQRAVPGINARVDLLSCEDLILFKLVAGRLIDRVDVAMLLRENRDLIDFVYLNKWLKRLSLELEFKSVWSEVFPAETPPNH